MKTFLNIIWHFPFLGFIFAFIYLLYGCLLCITVLFIPAGLGIIQLSKFLLLPHSRAMVSKSDLSLLTGQAQSVSAKTFSIVNRVLYFIPGVVFAFYIIIAVIGFCVTLIGIPNGIVLARSLSTIFNPVNKVCVPLEIGQEIERIKHQGTLAKYTMKKESVKEAKEIEVEETILEEVEQ